MFDISRLDELVGFKIAEGWKVRRNKKGSWKNLGVVGAFLIFGVNGYLPCWWCDDRVDVDPEACAATLNTYFLHPGILQEYADFVVVKYQEGYIRECWQINKQNPPAPADDKKCLKAWAKDVGLPHLSTMKDITYDYCFGAKKTQFDNITDIWAEKGGAIQDILNLGFPEPDNVPTREKLQAVLQQSNSNAAEPRDTLVSILESPTKPVAANTGEQMNGIKKGE